MTICFNGNNYKYEIEAVMKLFLPVQSFEFIFDGEVSKSEDYCIVSVNERDQLYDIAVEVLYNGTLKKISDCVSQLDECELILCRMLFNCMKELTGITPQWGFLTGIRPVKKVNQLIAKDYNKEQVFCYLKDKYSVSDEKLELAYDTAITQEKFLEDFNSNSYSLYVSIPFCPSRCSYCSFVSHSIESPNAKKLLPEYVDKLCEEIAQTSKIAKECALQIDTIYIGGGTPTTLNAEQLKMVMSEIEKNFDISKIREYTVEAGRADTISKEKLEIIKKMGATRISINPQTMNDNVLKAIGRNHTAQDVVDMFKLARSLGFDNINMDLIAGLPSDNVESFKDTLKEIIQLNPENITVHTLTIKRSSELYNEHTGEIDNGTAEMVSFAYKTLKEKGYMPYYLYRQKNTIGNLENVGYAKPSKECLYNIYIMEEIQTILAVGAGGSSKLVDTENSRIERLFNYKFPYEYISRNEQMLTKKQKIKDFYKLNF